MIPLTTLYDEYTDWPDMTKNPFEYLVPPLWLFLQLYQSNFILFFAKTLNTFTKKLQITVYFIQVGTNIVGIPQFTRFLNITSIVKTLRSYIILNLI